MAGSLFYVIPGIKTIVGYNEKDKKIDDLPLIKTGVIGVIEDGEEVDHVHKANFEYAKHYSVFSDFRMLAKYLP
jgi:hypothetical protein